MKVLRRVRFYVVAELDTLLHRLHVPIKLWSRLCDYHDELWQRTDYL